MSAMPSARCGVPAGEPSLLYTEDARQRMTPESGHTCNGVCTCPAAWIGTLALRMRCVNGACSIPCNVPLALQCSLDRERHQGEHAMSCWTPEAMCRGLRQKRMNLTKTIRKLPINQDGQRAGYYVHDDLSSVDIKYDDPSVGLASEQGPTVLLSVCNVTHHNAAPLTHDHSSCWACPKRDDECPSPWLQCRRSRRLTMMPCAAEPHYHDRLHQPPQPGDFHVHAGGLLHRCALPQPLHCVTSL